MKFEANQTAVKVVRAGNAERPGRVSTFGLRVALCARSAKRDPRPRSSDREGAPR
jgi:hypothetical protein